jgi:hypothetical protein
VKNRILFKWNIVGVEGWMNGRMVSFHPSDILPTILPMMAEYLLSHDNYTSADFSGSIAKCKFLISNLKFSFCLSDARQAICNLQSPTA